MENTEAASVEPSRAPNNSPSSQSNPSTKWQNTPTRPAVKATPNPYILKVLKEDYRIMLCNDYEFKKTKQFRDLKWESKKAFKKWGTSIVFWNALSDCRFAKLPKK